MGGFLSADSSSPEDPNVLTFDSSPNWQLHFIAVKGTPKLVVIDFSATWCGPCRFIEPVFRDMAARFTDVEFVKIDVDKLPDVAKEYDVQGMPTFVLLKEGKEVDRVVGAKRDELLNKVEKHKTPLAAN